MTDQLTEIVGRAIAQLNTIDGTERKRAREVVLRACEEAREYERKQQAEEFGVADLPIAYSETQSTIAELRRQLETLRSNDKRIVPD